MWFGLFVAMIASQIKSGKNSTSFNIGSRPAARETLENHSGLRASCESSHAVKVRWLMFPSWILSRLAFSENIQPLRYINGLPSCQMWTWSYQSQHGHCFWVQLCEEEKSQYPILNHLTWMAMDIILMIENFIRQDYSRKPLVWIIGLPSTTSWTIFSWSDSSADHVAQYQLIKTSLSPSTGVATGLQYSGSSRNVCSRFKR